MDCPISGTGEAWVEKTHISGDELRMTLSYIEIMDRVGDHAVIIPEVWVIRYRENIRSIEENFSRTSTPYRENASAQSLRRRQQRTVILPRLGSIPVSRGVVNFALRKG